MYGISLVQDTLNPPLARFTDPLHTVSMNFFSVSYSSALFIHFTFLEGTTKNVKKIRLAQEGRMSCFLFISAIIGTYHLCWGCRPLATFGLENSENVHVPSFKQVGTFIQQSMSFIYKLWIPKKISAVPNELHTTTTEETKPRPRIL